MTDNNEIKIKWQGVASHFICARRCQYHLSTTVEGFGKCIVVSTVGDMRIREDAEPEPVGCDRFFETMVFHGKPCHCGCGHITADAMRGEIPNDLAWSVADRNGYLLADSQHQATVDSIVARMRAGDEFSTYSEGLDGDR